MSDSRNRVPPPYPRYGVPAYEIHTQTECGSCVYFRRLAHNRDEIAAIASAADAIDDEDTATTVDFAEKPKKQQGLKPAAWWAGVGACMLNPPAPSATARGVLLPGLHPIVHPSWTCQYQTTHEDLARTQAERAAARE